MLLNRGFMVNSIDGKAPRDGSPLMLKCSKKDGLTLLEVRGFSNTEVCKIDPFEAEIIKVGPGSFNAWTGRHRGEWEVRVHGSPYGGTFGMRNRGDAIELKVWVEGYAKRVAKLAKGKEKPPESVTAVSEGSKTDGVQKRKAEELQHEVFLKSLCLRLNNVRGRATLEEVDRDLREIIRDVEKELEGSTMRHAVAAVNEKGRNAGDAEQRY